MMSYALNSETLELAWYSESTHAVHSMNKTHETESFFAILVQYNCYAFQEHYARSFAQLFNKTFNQIDMIFRIDSLLDGLVKSKDGISYYPSDLSE